MKNMQKRVEESHTGHCALTSTAVPRGTSEKLLVIDDITPIIEVKSEHTSLSSIYLRVAHVDCEQDKEMLRVKYLGSDRMTAPRMNETYHIHCPME